MLGTNLNFAELMRRHVEIPIPVNIPEDVRSLIQRCCLYDPEQRIGVLEI